jgi:hypothetical protein
LLIAALGFHGLLYADDSVFDVHGSVAGAVSSGNRQLDDETGVTGVIANLKMDIRPLDDGLIHVDAYRQNWASSDEYSALSDVREAYAELRTDVLRLRLGKQIIAWGRADKFNPTDNLTPRNYELLSADDEDQRFGTNGARLSFLPSDRSTVSVVWLPEFRSSRVPRGLLPASIAAYPARHTPGSDQAQWGVKYDHSGDGFDWSVSYYEGFSLFPEIGLDDYGAPFLGNARINVSGFDFARVAGTWVLRGEVASVRFSGRDPSELLPGSYVYGVAGAEYAFGESGLLSLQWLHRTINQYHDPRSVSPPYTEISIGNALLHSQMEKRQDGVAVRIARHWRNDSVRGEIGGLYLFDRHDYALRVKAQYVLSDHWTVSVVGDVYRGPPVSVLGVLRDNTLACMEVAYGF